jgi:VCBS repeat-containing protein
MAKVLRAQGALLCAAVLGLLILAGFAVASRQLIKVGRTDAHSGPQAPRCAGERATITGTAGDDDLVGTKGRDVIAGLGGKDRIGGRGGDDLLCGGDGGDVIDGGPGKDFLHGGGGEDRISGQAGDDRLFGEGGNDDLDGGVDVDGCHGGKGSDATSNCEPARAVVPLPEPSLPPANRAPRPADILRSTDEDTAVSIDLLQGASDPDADALRLESLDTSGTVAQVRLDGGGSARFDPSGRFDSLAPGESATDSFGYTIADGHGLTARGLATITVQGVDDLPVATDDAAALTQNDPATPIDVITNDADPDGGPRSIASVGEPEHGTASIVGGGFEVAYQPDPDYCNDGEAPDSFSYSLNGGSTATVMVTVACVTTVTTSVELFPAFDPKVSDYVVRCDGVSLGVSGRTAAGASISVDAAAPETGKFEDAVPLGENEEFGFSVDEGGEELDYHVRCLPAGFPMWNFDRLLQPAHQFYVVTPPAPSSEVFAVVFDDNGVPVWWRPGNPRLLDAKVLADGSIAWWQLSAPGDAYEIRNLKGEVLRVIRAFGGSTDLHELQPDQDGNFLIISYQPRSHVDLTAFGGGADDTVVDAVIEAIDPAGNEVWHWNSSEHISLGETGRWWPTALAQPSRDIVHMNAIEPVGGDALMISLRHTDAVYKIDKATGDVIWKLGGTWRPESLKIVGDPEGAYPLGGQHDVRLLPDGTITIHDNNTNQPGPPRAVRYAIDEAAKTATFIEARTDPEVSASGCCGSARRSPDGSWLFSWGGNSLVTEFDAAGQRTFRLGFGGTAFSYRAVPAPDGVLSATALRAGMDFMHPR